MFRINKTLDGVFIDSWSQQDWNIGDEGQQVAYKRETSKLWNILKEKEAFQFMTLEDVLEELQFLRHENDRLNKIIEDDLAEIKQSLESAGQKISSNTDSISSAEQEISLNKESISSNTESIASTKQDLEDTQLDVVNNQFLIKENKNMITNVSTGNYNS